MALNLHYQALKLFVSFFTITLPSLNKVKAMNEYKLEQMR